MERFLASRMEVVIMNLHENFPGLVFIGEEPALKIHISHRWNNLRLVLPFGEAVMDIPLNEMDKFISSYTEYAVRRVKEVFDNA